MKNINERIKRALENENISFRELERRTGISRMTLQRYTTGETKKIGIDEIEKIAVALHTTSKYLMGWDEESNIPSESEIDQEIVKVFNRLSEEKQKQALDYLSYLASQK